VPSSGVPVTVPRPLQEVVATLAAQLRSSPSVNQRSGVSVRFSIGALETISAGALRRAVVVGEREAVARPVDLWAALPSLLGRVEFDALDEGREPELLERATRKALLEVWRRRLGGEDLGALVTRFDEGLVVDTSDVTSAAGLLGQAGRALTPEIARRLVTRLEVGADSPVALASALEFCLEGLYLTKRISKRSGPAPGLSTYAEGGV
jgi:magnesium chelatase subunit I